MSACAWAGHTVIMQTEPAGITTPDAEGQGEGVVYGARTLRPYHRRVWVWIVAFAVVVGIAVAVAMLARPGAKKSPEGTTVLGVAVGALTEAKVRAAVDGAVSARVGQPVRVTARGETFSLTPADAGVRLDADATVAAVLAATGPGTAVPPVLTVDEKTLQSKLGAHKVAATDPVVELAKPKAGVLDAKLDASFKASTRGVSVTPGRDGWKVDVGPAAAAFARTVRSGGAAMTAPVVAVKPTGEPADQLIGTFTTYHGCCAPRVTNIHRIASIIDGTVIKPGAVFSLDRTAGQRTTARGFVSAPAIVEGELEDQIGGGVSQFSTTLFNAAWFSGLPVLEHQPHSKYISRYPPGREATLDWGAIDQRIKNDTDAPVVIRTSYTGTSLTVALYGHTGDRKVVSTTGPRNPSGAEGGFSIAVTRKVYAGDRVTDTDTVRWTYTGLD